MSKYCVFVVDIRHCKPFNIKGEVHVEVKELKLFIYVYKFKFVIILIMITKWINIYIQHK